MTENHTPEAREYAREYLGMGGDEPNAGTGNWQRADFTEVARHFDVGRESQQPEITRLRMTVRELEKR